MVPGGHSPHDQGSAHTLQHALGNLGGRPKNWMPAPPPATTPAPPFSTNPPPFAAPGQARRNVHAPHQPHLLSTLAPAFASIPAPVPLSQTLVPGAAPDAAPPMIPVFPAGAAGGSYTPETPLEHVYMDAARHGSALHRPTHDGPAQQTRACQVQTSTQGQPVAPANRTIAPSRLVTGYTPGYTHPYFPHHSPSSVHPPSNTHSPSNMHPPGSAHSPTSVFPPSNVSPANSPMLDPGYAHASFASNQPSSHMALSHSPQNSQSANQGPNRIVLQVPTPEGSPHNPFNRTTSPLPWYTQEDCFNILNGFQGSTFQPQALDVQSKRLTVLRGAIERNDWLYLTMHQFYCMLTICPDSLPMDLRNLPKLPEAVGVLDAVLEPNQVLDPAALSFFSNFPFPMQTICVTWGPMFEQQLYQFRLFVSKIGNFEQLKHKCEQQHYLPLAPELANTLGINSVTFQSLIFTSLLRYIWRFYRNHPAQTHFETMAAKMLGKSQFECYHRPYPLDPVSFQDQLRIHSLQLKHIVEEFDNIFHGRNTHDHHHYHHHTSPRQQLQHPQSQHPQLQHPQPQPQHPQSNVETQRSVGGLPAQNPTPPFQAQNRTPPIRAPQGLTPRPATASAPTPPRLQQKQTQQGALLRSLDWVHPQSRVPYPARFSLHQAHLRSPVLCAESDSFPLYTFFNGFINPPVRLSKRGRFVESWTFTVPSDRLQFLAKTDHEPAGGPGKKNITESSQMVRLRCVKWKRDEEVPEEPVWAITDTSWMPYAYFSFNDKPLELRRKAQNGKDLAVDLTDLIKEGENTLEIAIVTEFDDTSHLDYLIAAEVVAVLSHDSIKKHSCRNRVPADEILQNIKNQLSVSGDDDEISVIQSNLTISLRDPFSQTKMCDTPVRSKTCRHNDCFDLDVFLESRPRKGDASVADQWRCPICGCDARPYMLFFDGFIDSVRHQLEIQGLADTRQIVMQQDGSWEPKAEVQDNSASARGESNGPPASETARTSVPADVEVIDLSD